MGATLEHINIYDDITRYDITVPQCEGTQVCDDNNDRKLAAPQSGVYYSPVDIICGTRWLEQRKKPLGLQNLPDISLLKTSSYQRTVHFPFMSSSVPGNTYLY